MCKYALEGLQRNDRSTGDTTVWKKLGPADCDSAAEWKQVKDKAIPPRLSKERAGLVTSVMSW